MSTPAVGILGGTSLLGSTLFEGAEPRNVVTPHGAVTVRLTADVAFVQRHGEAPFVPPHRINHHANIAAFKKLGIQNIAAVNSTGSLREDWPPGTRVVPVDYFNLFNPPTYFDEAMTFTVPGLDAGMREALLDAARALGHEVYNGGVYTQVQGPILETPAEIRFLATVGDLVGMTMAHEAILARELALNYATLCLIDNYANGIADTALALSHIDEARAENLAVAESILKEVIQQFPAGA